jgi:hypothetical protein
MELRDAVRGAIVTPADAGFAQVQGGVPIVSFANEA